MTKANVLHMQHAGPLPYDSAWYLHLLMWGKLIHAGRSEFDRGAKDAAGAPQSSLIQRIALEQRLHRRELSRRGSRRLSFMIDSS